MKTIDDTQRRLLDAAGRVFADKGFSAATVREICQEAEANIAAVNYYFRDKEKLYHAVLNEGFQCGFKEIPVPSWPEGTPPVQKLKDFIRVVLSRMLGAMAQPWQMQLVMRELSQASPAGLELVRGFIKPVYELLWSLLREALPGVPEEKIHLISFSIIGQCFYLRVGRKVLPFLVGAEEFEGYGTDRLVEHITEFSLSALGLHDAVATVKD